MKGWWYGGGDAHVWSSLSLCVQTNRMKQLMTHKNLAVEFFIIIFSLKLSGLLHPDLAVTLLLQVSGSSIGSNNLKPVVQGNQSRTTISKAELLLSQGNQWKGTISKDWVSLLLHSWGGDSMLSKGFSEHRIAQWRKGTISKDWASKGLRSGENQRDNIKGLSE